MSDTETKHKSWIESEEECNSTDESFVNNNIIFDTIRGVYFVNKNEIYNASLTTKIHLKLTAS